MSEDNLIEASPCKLRNGNWGCKTQQPVSVGDTVRIVTRANKQWRAEITQIVWTDDQTCICETASENSSSPTRSQPQAGSAASTEQRRAGHGAPEGQSPALPRTDAVPTDELDAMADAAAAQDDDFDDLMSAMQEFERDGR